MLCDARVTTFLKKAIRSDLSIVVLTQKINRDFDYSVHRVEGALFDSELRIGNLRVAPVLLLLRLAPYLFQVDLYPLTARQCA